MDNIRERLIALIQAILLENNQLEEMVRHSKFQKHFLPVILGLVRQLPALIGPMLENISDDDLRRGLEQFRDEFIPFILGKVEPALEPRVIHTLEEFDELLEREKSETIDPRELEAMGIIKNMFLRLGEKAATNENSPRD